MPGVDVGSGGLGSEGRGRQEQALRTRRRVEHEVMQSSSSEDPGGERTPRGEEGDLRGTRG